MAKTINLNRIRALLAEKSLTNHWLADKLGKTDMTVSRWCTNKAQPSLMQLVEIANALKQEDGATPVDLITKWEKSSK